MDTRKEDGQKDFECVILHNSEKYVVPEEQLYTMLFITALRHSDGRIPITQVPEFVYFRRRADDSTTLGVPIELQDFPRGPARPDYETGRSTVCDRTLALLGHLLSTKKLGPYRQADMLMA